MDRPSICAASSGTPANPRTVGAMSTLEAGKVKREPAVMPGPLITIGMRVEWS